MDLDEARDLLSRTEQERMDARTQIRSARTTLESCRLIIQGIVKRYPELESEDLGADDGEWELEDERPTGMEAVYRILLASEGSKFSVRGMVAELKSRGWTPNSATPANAVRTALERLRASPATAVSKGTNSDGTVVYWYGEEPF
jgi:hypothetical protein